MTEDTMRDYIEFFWDENEPIYSVWDEETVNKKLLCASHDEVVVLRYLLTLPLPEVRQKSVLRTLEYLEAEREDGKVERNGDV